MSIPNDNHWDALKEQLKFWRSSDISYWIFNGVCSNNEWDTLELELKFQRLFLKFTASRCPKYQNLEDLCLNAESLDALVKRTRRDWWDDIDKSIDKRECDDQIAVITLNHLKDMKSDIREVYRRVANSSLSHSNMSDRFLVELIDSLLEILKHLLRKVDLVDSLKIKLEGLEGKLSFLKILLLFTSERCIVLEKLNDLFTRIKIEKPRSKRAFLMSTRNSYIMHRKLNDLFTHAKVVADNAVYLCYSCLSDDMNNEMVDKLAFYLSGLFQEIDPVTPKIRQIYIGVLKAYSESSEPDLSTSKDEIAVEFAESLLKNVRELSCSEELTVSIRDQIEILQEELLFLRDFLMDPPNFCANTRSKATCSKAGYVVFSLYNNQMDRRTTKNVYSSLVHLLEEIKLFKTQIMEMWCGTAKSSDDSIYWCNLEQKLESPIYKLTGSKNKWDVLQLELKFQELFLEFTAIRFPEGYRSVKDLCLYALSLYVLVSNKRNIWQDSLNASEAYKCSIWGDSFDASEDYKCSIWGDSYGKQKWLDASEALDETLAEITLDHLKDFNSDIRTAFRMASMFSLSYNNMSCRDLIQFVDSLLEVLKHLLRFKVDLVGSLKIKLKDLEGKLSFLRILLLFTSERCILLETLNDLSTHVKGEELRSARNSYILHTKLNDLFTHAKVVADNAIYLSYSCLSDNMNQEMVDTLGFLLSQLLRDIDPRTPNVRQIYITVLKAYSESLQPDFSTSRDEIAAEFAESLLENVRELLRAEKWTVSTRGQIEILQEELLFLRDFLMDPPELPTNTRSKATWSKAGYVVLSLYNNKMNGETANEVYSSLVHLLEEIKVFKTEIMEVYSQIPKYPWSRTKLPNTEDLGFLDCFLRNLRDLLNERTDSNKFLNLPVEPLMEELKLFRSSLSSISRQHHEQVKLKVLWTRVTNVAYKAEFVIDSLLVGNGLRWKNFLWSCEVRKEIEVLKAEFKTIDEMYDTEIHSGPEISYQVSSQATSPEIQDVVVGFEDEEERLVEDLVRGSTNLMVVSVVGMPGQGKTYLAKRIFNNLIVKDYFDARGWCYVSQVYKRKYLLNCILSQLVTPVMGMSEMTDEELAGLLHKNLKGKRYLILMDDMWDVEAWKDLRRSFPDDNNGSRIMFTSRFHNLDLEMSARKIHHLRLFSSDESWHLLKVRLFQKEEYPSELLKVGQEIARNCNGLPLVVVVVAGILAKIDKNRPQWEEVANSLGSLIIGDPEKKPIKVIELSYNHLPDYLKSCFLYAGALLKENYMPVQKLIRLWIAEGFVHKVEPNSLESTAKDYLLDLIGRSLVMVADKKSTGDIKDCRVHDLVGDFCLEKAAGESFLQKVGIISNNTVYYQRRISCNEPRRFLMSSASSPHARTLLFVYNSTSGSISPRDISSITDHFKLLRVLDLESIYIRDTFPDEITSLALLRYLALHGNFDSIPPSVENLWNLLTFIVKGYSRTVHLPHTIWNMSKLRHLHIGLIAIPTQPSRSNACMDNLQTVSTLLLSSEDDAIVIVKALANVTSLRCIVSKNCNRLPVLATLSQLESLKVSSSQWFPTFEFSLPLNLKKLTISRFFLPWNKISIIGKLPNLEVLKLLDFAFSGEEWIMGDVQFPKLKFLKLKCLDIMKWSVSSCYFPPLEHLVIESCEKLEEIPSCLEDIPTLSKIEVRWCSNSLKEIVKQIQEEQQDYGNQLKVELD